MQPNPILTAFKTAAFAILAFLVFMAFWKSNRSDQVQVQVKEAISRMESRVNDFALHSRASQEASAALRAEVGVLNDTLKVLLERGVAAAQPSASTTPPVPEPVGDGAVEPASDSEAGAIPRWLSPKARALWGRHPNYLVEEEDPILPATVEAPGADPGGVLRRWYGPAPSGLNPLTTSDSNVTTHIEWYCLEGLAKRHTRNPSKYGPNLALRIEVNQPDYTEWTIFLRNDVSWHTPLVDLSTHPHLEGRHLVTAHDVKFTLDLILNQQVDAAHLRNYYSECEGCEVIDDHCCIIRWRKPQFNAIDFTVDLTLLPQFALAYDEKGREYGPDEIGSAFNQHWLYQQNKYVGCGPYYLAELEPSSHLTLRRFDQYFGALPAIREVQEGIFSGQSLNLLKFEGKAFDITELTAMQWDKKMHHEADNVFKDGKVKTEWVVSTSYAFIGWKQDHPIFRDVKVRTAMTLACDRERIRDSFMVGRAQIISGPQPIRGPFYPPDLDPLPFDLEAARRLLEEAGWKDGDGDGVLDKTIDGALRPFRFVATLPQGSETIESTFKMFREDLRKIGVEMELRFLEWKQFVEYALDGRKFDCTALSWVSDGWESDLYQIWHSKEAEVVPSSNFIGFADKEVDRMIEELRSTFEHEERVSLQRELHRRIAELQPYTFLVTAEVPVAYWPDRLGGVETGVSYRTRPLLRLAPIFVRR